MEKSSEVAKNRSKDDTTVTRVGVRTNSNDNSRSSLEAVPRTTDRNGPVEKVRNGRTEKIRNGPVEKVRDGPAEKVRNGPAEKIRNGPAEKDRNGPAEKIRNGPPEKEGAGGGADLIVRSACRDRECRVRRSTGHRVHAKTLAFALFPRHRYPTTFTLFKFPVLQK